ncbi:MAG: STAS domain-containing protein [Planctomycetes bacterium]|nr:STAS domain-containing protein [Planctomycetota bacterium]
MPELKITTKIIDHDITLIRLVGFLDAHTFEELDVVINDLFEKNIHKIVADLSALEYISSAGAGVFIGALAAAQENSGNIILAAANENIHEVFDLLGLTQIFTMTDSVETAAKAFECNA